MIRLLLLILLGFTAFTAIVYGIMLWARPDGSLMQMPASWLGCTPFIGYRIPGMVLCLVVGVLSLAAWIATLRRAPVAYELTLLAAVVPGGCMVVQVLLIHVLHPLQVLYLAIAAFLLAGAVYRHYTGTRQVIHALRLHPGNDLQQQLQQYVNKRRIKAGYLITCSGSLTQYNLRFANRPDSSREQGHFEIVSLSGTLSMYGSHLHMSVSDSTGRTVGGHLLPGNVVYTTAEIVIGETGRYIFTRRHDGTTPWMELQIKEN